MKYLLFSFCLVFCNALTSCRNSQNAFPDKISVVKSKDLDRIKGTKLFVAVPGNYKPIQSMVRLQRDNNTYFQAVEIPDFNFNDYKTKLTKAALESQGVKVDIDKPVNYNGYDAIYFSGPSKTNGETKLGLAFGDDSFVMVLVGVYQTSDKVAAVELNKLFTTSYYDKSFVFNPLELANFSFDESITGFKIATIVGNVFIYSPNGKADYTSSKQEKVSNFQFSMIETSTFSKAIEFLEETTTKYSVQGLQLNNIRKREILINGNQAFEMTMDTNDQDNHKGNVYQVIIHKGTTAVLFLAVQGENEQLLEKFKATALTIKM